VELEKIEKEKDLPRKLKEQFSELKLKQGNKEKLKRCSAKTKNGLRCKKIAVENSEFCSIHLNKSKG